MATSTPIKFHNNEHTSKEFDTELEAIRASVLVMGELVESQVRNVTGSLASGNMALMTRVIDDDHRVNAMKVNIDEVCTQVIARRQPTANDLRFVIAVTKAITDLEHIGNEAEKISRMAKMLSLNDGLAIPRYNKIMHAAEIALDMLSNSLDAFARLDVILAAQVVRQDDLLDDEFHAIMRNLIIFTIEDPHTISNALEMLLVAKAIERIGDHAQNMSEYVTYMIKGRDVRHMAAHKSSTNSAAQ